MLGSRASAGGNQRIAVNFAIAGQLAEFRQVRAGCRGVGGHVLQGRCCERSVAGGICAACACMPRWLPKTAAGFAIPLQVEELTEKPIEEMPVHVSDIFAGAS